MRDSRRAQAAPSRCRHRCRRRPDRKSTRLNSSHTEIYTLSLHDALPISHTGRVRSTNFGAADARLTPCAGCSVAVSSSVPSPARSEEHTSELQSHRDLHSFPTRRSSDLPHRAGEVNEFRCGGCETHAVRRLLRRGVVIGAVAGLVYAVWRVVASRAAASDGPGYESQPCPMPPRPVATTPQAPADTRSAVEPDPDGNCPI